MKEHLSQHVPFPTIGLPPVSTLQALDERQISTALGDLRSVYCPLRPSRDSEPAWRATRPLDVRSSRVDSGYTSSNDDDTSVIQDDCGALRADEFERNLAVRWLTSFIAWASGLADSTLEEDARLRLIDEAAFVLASFTDDVQTSGGDDCITRSFFFSAPDIATTIEVRLNDVSLSGTDHTDVGLQSWGASMVLADMMCASPASFGLDAVSLRASPLPFTIVELGAGTGLVSLTLAKLLPHLLSTPAGQSQQVSIIATDYHPAVLANLRTNIMANAAPSPLPLLPIHTLCPLPPVHACLLDWSVAPAVPVVAQRARLLVAADVVYAREHAIWLRDCAGRMLDMDQEGGACAFWLMVAARPRSERFAPLVDAVERAFADAEACPRAVASDGGRRVLRIVQVCRLEKRRGVGRGDEGYYKLYKIAWAKVA